MATTKSPRKPSPLEKTVIVALALYAFAVIGLDTFRPFLHAEQDRAWPWRWFPIATLGFEADNNGKIISVEPHGPAEAAGLKRGQHVDLSSVKPDRRAINKFVYVAHGAAYTMRVFDAPEGTGDVIVSSLDERFDSWNASTLLIAQASALFFVALCLYLIWNRATWSTWGFFAYGTWFNSGQYFVWYANLPTSGLVIFDALQAIVQALAMTGFLVFAMYFPDERPTGNSQRRWCLLATVFGALLVSGALGFFNFFLGWHTEIYYQIYYSLTFVVYFLAAWSFVRRFRELPSHRPRMRWIVAAGLVGLPCFLLADVYEATGLFGYLPSGIDTWIHEHDWVLNLMYASNVLLPAAVVYTALRHEVMSVRFGITRAVILSIIFLISIAALHAITTLPIETFMGEREALKPLALPLSLLLAVGLALVHNPLHGIVERVCAPKWYRAKRELQALAQQLTDNDSLSARQVEHALVERTSAALWLECAALFHRQRDDGFVIGTHLKWPRNAKRSFGGDDPWACAGMAGPVPLADPDEAPDEPELVVPVRRPGRQPASRIVVYGHHVTRERIDPDEARIIDQVARAAALAYMRLDLEALSAAAHPGTSPDPR